MAAADLPCDGDGACMRCKATPPLAEVLSCRTCATPWHATCLSTALESLAAAADWQCPDCSCSPEDNPPPASGGGGGGGASSELVAAVRAIEADKTLTEKEKAKRRQALMGGAAGGTATEEEEEEKKGKGNDVLELLGENFNCSICKTLPERPVTTPCGHNFCLKCFQKWVGQGRRICANCRATIPSKVASQPRINSALVVAIRMAKSAKSVTSGATTVVHYTRNEDRPDKAFTTERAKRAGKANACSGQIFVTVPPDHFGPIPAENDPKNNRGVLVGDSWDDRLDCRQWGVHLPHVAGIAGQSYHGAQSVALSGGYQDDEDHGEWFLYTGSGGRDLSGNKRTNKEQSSDQTFEKYNQALRVSCVKGYPVRVVRSFKEKRSSYAPEKGVRYDGIYRIEKCWRKVGVQGYLVCRYLFVRCDNEPAPWTSDEHGDRPRPLPAVKELKKAIDVTERKGSPSWDYDEGKGWTWMKPRPASRKSCRIGDPAEQKNAQKARRVGQGTAIRERLLKEFSCRICKNVMVSPLTTPCGHNFCKSCLLGSYADQGSTRERTTAGGRTLRAKKIIKKCVSCPTDISDFLQNPQVNRELMGLIESLQRQEEEENAAVAEEGNEADGSDYAGEDISGEEESDDAEVEKMDDEVSAGGDDKKNETMDNDGMKDEKKPDSPRSLERKKVAVPRAGNTGRKEKSNVGGSDESKANSEMPRGVEKHGGHAVKAAKRGRTKTEGNAAKKARKNMKAASVAADDDGNASPSSPLLVDDDDFQ